MGGKETEEENLSYFPLTMEQGQPIVDFCSTDFHGVIDKYSHLVASSFVGKRISYSSVKEMVTKVWNSSAFSIQSPGNHMFTFGFNTKELKKEFLEKGSFFITSHLFMVRVTFRHFPMEL